MESSSGRPSTSAPIAVCPIYPHIGALDSWLPVLWELKHRHPNVIFWAIVPESSVLRGVYPGDVIADLSESLFDRVLCQTRDGDLNIFGSFYEALQAAQPGSTFRFHSVAPRDRPPTAGTISLRDFSENVRLVCLDIKKIPTKGHFAEILAACRNAKPFSMPHGIGLRMLNSHLDPSGEHAHPKIAEECVAYIQSPHEASFYCERYGLQDRNLRVAGVVRHAASWVERIKNYRPNEERPTAPYIFIVSRRSSPNRFGLMQKIDALKDLSKLAQELNCKLVIRRHPAESVEPVYEEVLGIERYGSHWVYSSLHPFILGSEALFCVTFRSCVAVDMAVLGTPTIELFDFERLELGEEPTEDHRPFVKHDGRLTSFFQLHGLVLGARNYAELKMRAEEILNDRKGVAQRLGKAQRELYTTLPDPIAFVADDIESAAL